MSHSPARIAARRSAQESRRNEPSIGKIVRLWRIIDLHEICTRFAIAAAVRFWLMIANNTEFRTVGTRFHVAKEVRLIVDKMIPVFMIMACTPERSVLGEESVYGF